MIIIGIDPDVNASGFAYFSNGELTTLSSYALLDVFDRFRGISENQAGEENKVQVHIEDIHSNRAVWHKGGSGAARNVGRCEQIQLEIEKTANYFGFKVVRHPVSSKWKKGAGKKEFEKLTDWTGRTNEDMRSAAYFGYCGVVKNGLLHNKK